MEKFSQEVATKARAWFESDEIKAVLASIEKAAPSDTGTFEVVITTEHLDRYQEVIKLDGWDLTHYRNNPVVLWGHDHSRLIGMATSVDVIDGQMIAKGKFAPTEEGQEKRKLYEMGFLRATSVGFIAKETEGNLITKAELLEFSFVSVPANPHALSLAMEKELNINELVTKGLMHVEKGAVAEQLEDQEAFEKKWKNFSRVDDVVYSFWKVYFDKETPVGDFEKLLDEAVVILKDISGGKKDLELNGAIKELLKSPRRFDENDEKSLAEKVADAVAERIKQKDGALEPAPAGEAEGADDEEDVDEPETDDEKAFRVKKMIQQADTLLGEVLADLRRTSSPHA